MWKSSPIAAFMPKYPIRNEAICQMMESFFRQQQFETGIIEGIRAIDVYLHKHFPLDRKSNEI